jgi:hypothetical protein
LQGINDIDTAVGYYTTSSGVFQGFSLFRGDYTTINVPGASSTSVLGISDNGLLCGAFVDSENVTHGFVSQDGVFLQLDFPHATGTAVEGINRHGEIVGFYVGPTCALTTHQCAFAARPSGTK